MLKNNEKLKTYLPINENDLFVKIKDGVFLWYYYNKIVI